MCRMELLACVETWPLFLVPELQWCYVSQACGERGRLGVPVAAGPCGVRVLPGDGGGGGVGVDCTAAHCSTPGAQACWENTACAAAVC